MDWWLFGTMLWTIFFMVNVLLLLGRLRELSAQQQVTLNRIARALEDLAYPEGLKFGKPGSTRTSLENEDRHVF
jgi:hypothetical protein